MFKKQSLLATVNVYIFRAQSSQSALPREQNCKQNGRTQRKGDSKLRMRIKAGSDRRSAYRQSTLGHESLDTTQIYLDANLAMNDEIPAKMRPLNSKAGARFIPAPCFFSSTAAARSSQLLTISPSDFNARRPRSVLPSPHRAPCAVPQ